MRIGQYLVVAKEYVQGEFDSLEAAENWAVKVSNDLETSAWVVRIEKVAKRVTVMNDY